MKNKIKIECKGASVIDINLLEEFQGDLKSLSQENFNKLKADILELGFSEPISVWENCGKLFVLNGHQRLKTLKILKEEGYFIPQIPINFVDAKDFKTAKKKVLALASEFGTPSEDGFYNFINESGLNFDDIQGFSNLTGIDYNSFKNDFFGKDDQENSDYNPYTSKIEAPIYKPTGNKPEINQLYNKKKFKKLINEIKKSNIPDNEKAFLKLAAYRHIVFNYQNIAEYYAHSSSEVQNLMENSALVIIDFNKAIENGFVEMTNFIAETYLNDE